MKLTTKTSAWTLLLGLVATASEAAARPPERHGEHGDKGDFGPGDLSGPLTGSIEISNERQRSVEIYIDGRFALEVGARGTAIIPEIPNGVRLVAYGDRRHAFEVDKVEVRVDRRSALRIAPLRGYAIIRNDSGVAMRVRFGDDDLGVVLPGQDLKSSPMLEGSYSLSYFPRDGRGVTPRAERVSIVPGDTTRLTLAPFYAALTVRNPFPYDVNLFLGATRVGKIDRFGELRLDTLMPGRVDAQLRKQSKVLAAATIDLDAGRVEHWDPQGLRFGDLDVINPTQSRVRLQVGAMTGFVLRPGESRSFANLDAGALDVQLTLDDGRVVRHVTEIRAGERTRFEVPRAFIAPGPVPVRPQPY